MNINNLNEFTRGYIECAIWSGGDDVHECSIHDLSAETIAVIIDDCNDFMEAGKDLLKDLDDSQSGHDFSLTRNGHGAGFWDRGLGDIGDKLTKLCKPYGSFDLYVGDDGLIYHI